MSSQCGCSCYCRLQTSGFLLAPLFHLLVASFCALLSTATSSSKNAVKTPPQYCPLMWWLELIRSSSLRCHRSFFIRCLIGRMSEVMISLSSSSMERGCPAACRHFTADCSTKLFSSSAVFVPCLAVAAPVLRTFLTTMVAATGAAVAFIQAVASSACFLAFGSASPASGRECSDLNGRHVHGL